MCQIYGHAVPKFNAGDVVYVRAIVSEVGECGTPCLRIAIVGGHALVVPDVKEVHRAKSKTTRTTIELETTA